MATLLLFRCNSLRFNYIINAQQQRIEASVFVLPGWDWIFRRFKLVHTFILLKWPLGTPGHTLRTPVRTHLCRCGGAACRSSAPLWRSSPPRCFRARTRTRPGARAPSAAPECCCTAARPPGAPSSVVARRRRHLEGCGCGACWGSDRAPPRCVETSARPGWWTGRCWSPPPGIHRRTGAAAPARDGEATLSGEVRGRR